MKACPTCGYDVDRYSPDAIFCSVACGVGTIQRQNYLMRKYGTNSERIQNASRSSANAHRTPSESSILGPNFLKVGETDLVTRYQPWFQVKEEVERRGFDFSD